MSHLLLAAIDEALLTDGFLDDPYPLLRMLREKEPVFWSESIGGWILTRYDDVIPTFRDVDRFSNEGRLAKVVEYLPDSVRSRFAAIEAHYRAKSLLQSDPPDHTRLRALVVKVFNAARVEAMRPTIQKIVNDMLDAVEQRHQMDVIHELAFPLPFAVLGSILGVPETNENQLKQWADELLLFQGVNRPSEDLLERSQNALINIREYLVSLVKERRRSPGQDLISHLIIAESEQSRLTEQELVYTCITLLVAGHETTTSLIGNGLFTILSHPEEWRKLRENHSVLSSAIEEMLRFESPVARQPRLVREDTELGGKKLLKGQVVFQMLNAANRDPAYFSDPDNFSNRAPEQ